MSASDALAAVAPGARRCGRIRAHLGLSVQKLIHDLRIHEQENKVTGRAPYLETDADTTDRIHRRSGPLAVEVLAPAAEQGTTNSSSVRVSMFVAGFIIFSGTVMVETLLASVLGN